ncbi:MULTISPECIES: bifunctional tRNA (5-methylaminomethyl-2-thiouridine)(34)-methyltransferase MnmD/FAD-dependent 5-carboxymethylaminomethyl-2-thiouridine(34) oxidoreductase MnmC [unclassified Pseudoalteromonas]|uniref:bifunctional tRNA (5-methylaminomethyl-2-thiouridine)(34)-methyltransferase MnmD/FAD-dependent 5-carboxymethylaminomethyl-2-thiouridine(34) oxidoreductase MnmC n=1 Tax=unclassified Pseudoalteromonas TaxID=194690 RepID=UPI0019D1E4EE|nr:bifunctional tRNA (5-methylaminomethyl-2-thiouridine)(34)-methyltransferase MnmD/FAD-dependent 5-carboxymethylaminomethyl-2-thiouridine(34) oxidoreductase MnmC [Pseudoalteromonas sp. JC3]MBR8841463.1 bifunctional tRNA (5-methylaminomethyl-2-thiouridine)(34)-methyltransferase MnmD/FAD-dependent 5-carboxymethylaminomethyl-2-thiouridine(34) oxidoreductase MnmC [Pseudoalteromonas sp. JC3]WJE07485.1 bifunctional tRNA (5-methylaminomethyl-2-thiouridine)(34)-methyltransferase MnmD/FAD-dependent 5-car
MIKNAQIHFNDAGTPVADSFDDVYFSNDDGLAESHYVFYTQNHIDERLQNHGKDRFVIAETGFGTGLNFLNAWYHFNQRSKDACVNQLHFVSFEKYPIHIDDLVKALQAWPTLAPLAKKLCQQYPMALEGCHRLEFDNGQVTLDLWFGDIHDNLPQLSFEQAGFVDAWFLDGFAPSKNPEMWQQSLFDAMANMSRDSATLATFTAAGFVRRGLQDAGFACKKVKGFGRKREMVVGTLSRANKNSNTPAYYSTTPRKLESIAIIGGGIASSCLLYHLSKRDLSATLFCQDDTLAKGASHNRQGALYPNLQADHTPSSELYAHSFLYAKRLYQHIANTGYHFAHDWCGVLLQSVSEAKRAQHQNLAEKATWSHDLIHAVDAKQASAIANTMLPYGGLYIPEAGWLNPAEVTHAVFDAAHALKTISTYFNTDIQKLEKAESGWLLHSEDNTFGPFSDVFVCGGEHSDRFEQTKHVPLHGVRGQVSHVDAGEESQKLNTVLCHKGYFTPEMDGQHCMGATFEKNSKSREIKAEDDAANRAQLERFYKDTELAASLGEITSAKAAVRCCFNDHLPMLGQVQHNDEFCSAFANLRKGKHYGFGRPALPYQGIHIVTGFGARGLCSAPLATEHLVATLLGEARPLSERVHQAIHPARLLVRDLIRNKI